MGVQKKSEFEERDEIELEGWKHVTIVEKRHRFGSGCGEWEAKRDTVIWDGLMWTTEELLHSGSERGAEVPIEEKEKH